MKYNFDELRANITAWATERNLIPGDPMAQAGKTLEEVAELVIALNAKDREEVVDAYGDIMVTLIVGMGQQGIVPEEALAKAWDVIKDRKGKMVNGVFVKEAG